MLLLEEIAIEIVMIAAVVVAVGCLAYLLQLSVRERVYLARFRRHRQAEILALVSPSRPQELSSRTARSRQDAAVALREKHV